MDKMLDTLSVALVDVELYQLGWRLLLSVPGLASLPKVRRSNTGGVH